MVIRVLKIVYFYVVCVFKVTSPVGVEKLEKKRKILSKTLIRFDLIVFNDNTDSIKLGICEFAQAIFFVSNK